MIAKNTSNIRNVNWRVVHKYARAMQMGLWQFNGEPIVFDEDGVLKNGQHRLLAVLESGVAIKALVIKGTSRNVDTYDECFARTLKQRASAEGLSLHSSTLGAISLIINKFNNDNTILSNDEKIRFAWDHVQELKKAESFCNSGGGTHGLMRRSGCIAAVYCEFKLLSFPEEKIKNFCSIANTGMPNGILVPDSALALRNTILEGFRSDDGRLISGTAKVQKMLFECTWQAMNWFMDGKKLNRRRKIIPDGCGQRILKALDEPMQTTI